MLQIDYQFTRFQIQFTIFWRRCSFGVMNVLCSEEIAHASLSQKVWRYFEFVNYLKQYYLHSCSDSSTQRIQNQIYVFEFYLVFTDRLTAQKIFNYQNDIIFHLTSFRIKLWSLINFISTYWFLSHKIYNRNVERIYQHIQTKSTMQPKFKFHINTVKA